MTTLEDNNSNEEGIEGQGDQYDVGYGKPPKEHRFRRGKSGNPNGRPPGSKNKPIPASEGSLMDLVFRESNRVISIQTPEGMQDIQLSEAIVRSLFVKAAKGHSGAQRLALELISRREQTIEKGNLEYFEGLANLKMEGEKIIENARRSGKEPPKLVPHPDDIYLEPMHGAAFVIGPIAEWEVEIWDLMRTGKSKLDDQIEKVIKKARKTDDPARRKQLFDELKSLGEEGLQLINQMVSKGHGVTGDKIGCEKIARRFMIDMGLSSHVVRLFMDGIDVD